MAQTIQIKRTPTAGQAPAAQSLQQGELAVEMATMPSPRLWVGVPTTADASGRRLVADLSAGAGVNPGTIGQVAYYAATGAAVSGSPIFSTSDGFGFTTDSGPATATGANGPYLDMRTWRGSRAAQTALLAGDALGLIDFDGHAGGTVADQNGVVLRARTTEAWTPTGHGAEFEIFAHQNATASTIDPARIASFGNGMQIGDMPTGGYLGLGTVNAATGFYVNGASILASPAFTGTPTATAAIPTADNTTRLATTAFVMSSIGAATAGVSSITAGPGLTATPATGAVTIDLVGPIDGGTF